MTQGSINKFPKVTLTEQGSAPDNPDSGDQRVYIRTSDHHLVRVNSSGTVTDIESTSGTIGGSTGATDNAIIRADGTGGATVQNSLATVSDTGGVNIPTGQTYDINGSPHTHAGGAEAHILVRDKKAQNTSGGTASAGNWLKRDINEEVYDTGGDCSIASNQITLAAGTYRCRISCPAFNTVNRHKARLQDVTNAVTLALGVSSNSIAASQSESTIVGRFTLSGSTVCEVQHWCESQSTVRDLGVESNAAEEIYTVAEFWKE